MSFLGQWATAGTLTTRLAGSSFRVAAKYPSSVDRPRKSAEVGLAFNRTSIEDMRALARMVGLKITRDDQDRAVGIAMKDYHTEMSNAVERPTDAAIRDEALGPLPARIVQALASLDLARKQAANHRSNTEAEQVADIIKRIALWLA